MTKHWQSPAQKADHIRYRRNTPASAGSDVAEQLSELGCDPIAGMARIAQDDSLPAALRARVYAELAGYVAPRRKAVELTGLNGGPVDIELSLNALSDDELRMLLTLLEKAGVGSGR